MRGIRWFVILALALAASFAAAQVFVLVPKSVDNPVFLDAADGCRDAAEEKGVTCEFVGPTATDEAEQIRVLQDLITRGVAGMSVSPVNAEAATRPLNQAVEAGIHVITFDSDAPDSMRAVYVGTNNYQIGVEEAALLQEYLPEGGSYAIITGTLAAANLNERIDGFRDNIDTEMYQEVAGSPFPCDDDVSRGVQLVSDILTRYPDIDAIVMSGGWPLFAPEGYRAALGPRAEDVREGRLIILSVDTLDPQLALMADGLVTALVGQRFYEMGYRSLEVLYDLAEGITPESDIVFTGLDVVTHDNLEAFMEGRQE
jgi:ribose transport system substrate-binding protein